MHSFRKKISYIWDYYKVPIIAFPLIIALIIYVISEFTAPKQEIFSVYVINQDLSLEEVSSLKETLADNASILQDFDDIAIEHSLFIDKENSDPDSQMIFTTAIAGHTIDLMISDELFLDQYASMDALLDLKDLFSDNTLQTLAPYLLTRTDKNGVEKIFGISLEDCSYFSEYGFDTPVLTIAKYSEHTQPAAELILWLFKQPNEPL